MSIWSRIKDKVSPEIIEKSYDPIMASLALNNTVIQQKSVYDDVVIEGAKDIDDTDGYEKSHIVYQ